VLIFEHAWPAAAAMGITVSRSAGYLGIHGSHDRPREHPRVHHHAGGVAGLQGLHWLVIHNSTIPVQIGGQRNLLSALATYYLPQWLGFVLAAAVVAGFAGARCVARARRLRLGLEAESIEMTVATVLVIGQLIFLFVLVTNQFQGVPLSAVILAATALVITSSRSTRPLAGIFTRSAATSRPRPLGHPRAACRHYRLRPHGA